MPSRMGHMTLRALLVLGGTIACFLVDPVLFILDLKPSQESKRERHTQ